MHALDFIASLGGITAITVRLLAAPVLTLRRWPVFLTLFLTLLEVCDPG